MIRKLKSLLTKMYIKLQEQTREERLKYSFPKKHSDTLMVVFFGFTDKLIHSYVRIL